LTLHLEYVRKTVHSDTDQHYNMFDFVIEQASQTV